MNKLITTTWGDSIKMDQTFLYRSFIKNNPESDFIHIHYDEQQYKSLKEEFQERFDFQHEYILYKIFLLRRELEKVDSDIVIFADATDVVCNGNIQEIYTDQILFSAEINQYPSSFGDWGGIDYSAAQHENKEYLNSGLIAAPKNKYLELLDSVIENILPLNLKSFGGDQGIYTFHYISGSKPSIKLDIDRRYFLSTFMQHAENFKRESLPLFVHDNGWNWGSPQFIIKFNLI